jgi:hypothetical protein
MSLKFPPAAHFNATAPLPAGNNGPNDFHSLEKSFQALILVVQTYFTLASEFATILLHIR